MTVKMRKGDLFADIFDSPETIAQARREGYSLVDPEAAKSEEKTEPLEPEPDTPARDELIRAAIEKGFEEDHPSSLSDEELAALLKSEE
jgi:hypothetical protein